MLYAKNLLEIHAAQRTKAETGSAGARPNSTLNAGPCSRRVAGEPDHWPVYAGSRWPYPRCSR
jgi:hypothetical protein